MEPVKEIRGILMNAFRKLAKQLHIGDEIKGKISIHVQPKNHKRAECTAIVKAILPSTIRCDINYNPDIVDAPRELRIATANTMLVQNKFNILCSHKDYSFLFVVDNFYL